MVRKASTRIFLTLVLTVCVYFLIDPAKGMMIIPERKNRIPAKCKGVVYGSPIFIPTKAEDHNKQAVIARNVVLKMTFFKINRF